MAHILVVDDEQSMREFLAILLEREGYAVEQAENATTALQLLGQREFDLVLSDVNMPGLDGISLLREINQMAPYTAVLLVTAFSSAEQAVEAMKLGAFDYIPKPFKVEEIKLLVRNALETRDLKRENIRLKQEVRERYPIKGLIGKSRKMKELYALIEKYAASAANVLIYGESGTGKELAARAIHFNGPRGSKPFVAINCGAIPDTLIESELFGHRKGSFTGAVADRPGLFEQADGGTLFLDEIGEVPLQLQTKLLRVLQEREFRRIGDTQDRKCDVRIIAASNRNLEDYVKEGGFREDLFYRLNVLQLTMPPLRERSEDIPLLVDHFYEKFAGRPPLDKTLTAAAFSILMKHPFPGNVRELENLVERCVVMGNKSLCEECLPPQVLKSGEILRAEEGGDIPETGMNLEAYLDGIEKRFLLQALERSGGVKKKAAELLGLTFRSFRYRLAKFGMDEE